MTSCALMEDFLRHEVGELKSVDDFTLAAFHYTLAKFKYTTTNIVYKSVIITLFITLFLIT
jgi:hypothetical protein